MMTSRDTRKYVLAIDAGTTCVTVILFDLHARKVASASAEIEQHYPQPGWVEHDAEEIRDAVLSLMQRAAGAVAPSEIAAIGITNQRETAILWDRATGRPVCNAIVWQCRRTQDICERLERNGLAPKIQSATGLRIDSYFSATKVMWMLENVPGLRERCRNGEIAFGTVDSWLLWNLTGGAVHATDFTNASRTMLYNIDSRQWDDELLSAMDIPRAILPEVRETSSHFGNCVASVLGEEVEIHSLVGDQQAALFGQGCVSAGEAKNTYGTGCFLLVNTGVERCDSRKGMLTTLACGPRGQVVYALEGAMFSAGAAVQWLRDGLGMIRKPNETEELAASVPDTGGVYLVPAFTGLGAPYWNMAARGAILGLTRGSTKAHIARATLECIAYQVADLVELAASESGIVLPALKADGGASSNEFLMQFQADVLGIPIQIPDNTETTALGAAMLAGLSSGVWHTAEELDGLRRVGKLYKPDLREVRRKELLDGWRAAIDAVLKMTGGRN